jgi:translation initiation factor IF-3
LHDTDPNLVRNINHIPDNVRLVDIDRTWLASRSEVQMRIKETSLDLYLVNKDSNPPVYKILDYGKYRFNKQKKEREQKKKMREQNRTMKEFKFKPNIDGHDIKVKLHQIKENISNHDIKICMDLKTRNGNKQNIFILTNRGKRSIEEAISSKDFPLNIILNNLQDIIQQPCKLTITENQIFTIIKYNGAYNGENLSN